MVRSVFLSFSQKSFKLSWFHLVVGNEYLKYLKIKRLWDGKTVSCQALISSPLTQAILTSLFKFLIYLASLWSFGQVLLTLCKQRCTKPLPRSGNGSTASGT